MGAIQGCMGDPYNAVWLTHTVQNTPFYLSLYSRLSRSQDVLDMVAEKIRGFIGSLDWAMWPIQAVWVNHTGYIGVPYKQYGWPIQVVWYTHTTCMTYPYSLYTGSMGDLYRLYDSHIQSVWLTHTTCMGESYCGSRVKFFGFLNFYFLFLIHLVHGYNMILVVTNNVVYATECWVFTLG